MTTAYVKARKELAEKMGDDGNRLPCVTCQTPTLRETLSQYGARCFGCYEAYCRAGRGPEPTSRSAAAEAIRAEIAAAGKRVPL